MSCDCDSVYQTVFTKVSPSLFAEVREEYMEERDGVSEYNWEVSKSGQLIEYISVNQSSYQNYNYFKYRSEIESESNVTVLDIEDGLVKLEYDCVLTLSVDRCLECHIVSDRYQELLDTRVISECTVNSEDRSCANSVL